jgi:hypothetical protein
MAKPIHEIMAEASASRDQPFGGNLERYNVRPAPTAEQRRSSGDMSSQEWHSQQQRDLQGGLRSLALKNYNEYDRGNPYLAEPLSFTGSSWPGGRERYLSRYTNPEALYRQNKEIYPRHMVDYWGKNPSTDPRNPENEELYKRRYLEGIQPYDLFLGNEYRPNYEGYSPSGGYEMFKEGFPVEGWNEYEQDKQGLGAEFGLGEFSGTEFPPRPLDYDADEFGDTYPLDDPTLPSMLTPGSTGVAPIDTSTPTGIGEFQTSPPEMFENNRLSNLSQTWQEILDRTGDEDLANEWLASQQKTANLGNYDLFHLMQNGYSLEEALEILDTQLG